VVEAFATAALIFVSGQIGTTLMSYGTNQIGIYIIVVNTLLLSVFIYATAPASGGHVNPMITFTTMLAGLCPLPRGNTLFRSHPFTCPPTPNCLFLTYSTPT